LNRVKKRSFSAPLEDQAEARQSLAIPIPGISSGKSKRRKLVDSSIPRFLVLLFRATNPLNEGDARYRRTRDVNRDQSSLRSPLQAQGALRRTGTFLNAK